MSRDRKVTSHGNVQEVLVEDRKAQKLFSLVAKFLNSLERVESVTRKTQVTFKHGRGFAWIWLPQMWIKKQPDTSITLSFTAGHPIQHEQIKKKVEPQPGYWTHHVVIEKKTDFSNIVREWLREARAFGARGGETSQ